MPETYWTIDCNGVEKTLADWGIDACNFTMVSQGIDVMTLVTSGKDFDSTPAFPIKSTCRLWGGRTLTGTSFSDGKVWFYGRVTKIPRTADGGPESISYELAGPAWYLANLGFEQMLRIYRSTTTWDELPALTVVLNQNKFGQIMYADLQMKEILDYAVGKGAPISYSFGELLSVFRDSPTNTVRLKLPTTERPNVTCEAALVTELSWIPDCEWWFDHSTGDVGFPTFHVKRRSGLTNVSFDSTEGKAIKGLHITERSDLRKDRVEVNYRIPVQVDDASWINVISDNAGLDTTSAFDTLRQTVDLAGSVTLSQKGHLDFAPFPTDLTNTDWWKSKLPYLNECTTLTIHSATRNTSYANELLPGGPVADWMGVAVADEEVVALADWELPHGQKAKNQKLTVRTKATNASGSGNYSKTTTTEFAETPPGLIGYSGTTPVFSGGLAAELLQALSQPMFEGQFSLTKQEIEPSLAIGAKLSLTNGIPEWATMGMPIKSVSYDVQNGTTSASFGPNRWLSAGELMDLMRVNRTRTTTHFTTSRASGSASGIAEVDTGKAVAQERSSGGSEQTLVSVTTDTPDGSGREIVHDTDGVVQSYWQKVDDANLGKITLKLASYDDHEGTRGQDIRLQVLQYSKKLPDNTCVDRWRIFLCSDELETDPTAP